MIPDVRCSAFTLDRVLRKLEVRKVRYARRRLDDAVAEIVGLFVEAA